MGGCPVNRGEDVPFVQRALRALRWGLAISGAALLLDLAIVLIRAHGLDLRLGSRVALDTAGVLLVGVIASSGALYRGPLRLDTPGAPASGSAPADDAEGREQRVGAELPAALTVAAIVLGFVAFYLDALTFRR